MQNRCKFSLFSEGFVEVVLGITKQQTYNQNKQDSVENEVFASRL